LISFWVTAPPRLSTINDPVPAFTVKCGRVTGGEVIGGGVTGCWVTLVWVGVLLLLQPVVKIKRYNKADVKKKVLIGN